MTARLSQIEQTPFNSPNYGGYVTGTTGPEVLTGTDPTGNVINAGAGPDTLIGSDGWDLFRDGPGADSIVGGAGFDRLSFSWSAGTATEGVVADLATQTVYDDGFGNVEHMSSIEGLGAGTRFADTLSGDDNANYFLGDVGDVLYGRGGDDVFELGGAPALIDGGAGVNTVFFNGFHTVIGADGHGGYGANTHGVSVDLSRGLIIDDGNGGSGQLVNIQNVYGSPSGDVIIGDHGDNVLMGLAGDDTLTGGAGKDVIYYNDFSADPYGNAASNGHDVITDFNAGQDRIVFDMAAVRSMADLTIASDGAGDLVITYGAGETITLLHVHHLSAKDFVFGGL